MALLEATGLSIAYTVEGGLLHAVRGVDLCVDRGEVLGIVGESGSGKSTVAHALMGYRASGAVITSGRISFDGVPLLDQPANVLRRLWGRRIAMIHQNSLATLTPTMAVGRQIAEVVRQHRRTNARDAERIAADSLRAVNIPSAEQLMKRYPHQLSGGQRQRISIAIALSLEPDLLILDEPTTSLDVTTEAVILDLLQEIQARTGLAMVYISHNLGVIARIASKVAVMYAGEIVETGPAADMLHRARHPYTRALLDCLPRAGLTKRDGRLRSIGGALPSLRDPGGGCIFRERCRFRSNVCDAAPGWAAVASDHAVRCWNQASDRSWHDETPGPATNMQTGGDIVLELANVTKTFGNPSILRHSDSAMVRAVSAASATVRRSTIVGLVGESGSGKTTLLRCIAGLERSDSGTIRAMGADLPTDLEARGREALRTIQMVFQDPESTLNPAITVGGNLRRHLLALRQVDSATAMAEVRRALASVRLDSAYADRLPAELSGGEKQRVAIARAFLSHPSLVLCDEPLSALDVSVQSAIVQLLLDLQRENEASYIVVSHDLSVVRYIADRIVIMYLGRIIEEGPSESFDLQPLHPYTEALFSAVPTIDGESAPRRIRLTGQISEQDKLTPGCLFASRCPRKLDIRCEQEPPPWRDVGGRRYRCHHAPDNLLALQQAPIPDPAVTNQPE